MYDFQFILLKEDEEIVNDINNSFINIEINGTNINVKGIELTKRIMQFIEDHMQEYTKNRIKYRLTDLDTAHVYKIYTKYDFISTIKSF